MALLGDHAAVKTISGRDIQNLWLTLAADVEDFDSPNVLDVAEGLLYDAGRLILQVHDREEAISMTSNKIGLVQDYREIGEDIVCQIEGNWHLELIVIVVDIDLVPWLGHWSFKAHEDESVRRVNGIQTPTSCHDYTDRLGKVPEIGLNLVNFYDLFHHATLNEQVSVGKKTDILEHAHVLEPDRAVWYSQGLSEIEVVKIFIVLIE